jgi:glycine hydroxymethyltransferase
MMERLYEVDAEVAALMQAELERQKWTLDLIAAENIAPAAILETGASVFTNKAAEGYPGKRFHSGCVHTDAIETLAITRAKDVFQAEHANVQPHCGVNANMAVYFAVLKIGDPVLSMKLDHGGHLSHGANMSLTGHAYQFTHYGVNRDTEQIDYAEVRELARQCRPKMIVGGASSYPRLIDYAALRDIADEVGAYLLIDMAHIAGLVAAGVIPSPVPHADFVTFTTYKTLMGGRGGVILCKAKYGSKVDRAIFPGVQGTPAIQLIAAKAVCFKQAGTEAFRAIQRQTLANARQLCAALQAYEYRVVTGGTENHLVLVDLRNKGLKGNAAESVLERIGVLVNKNVIPYDTESPMVTSGLRFGTPALTTRGMQEPEMAQIAEIVHLALSNSENTDVLEQLRQRVRAFCEQFLIYQDL